MITSDLPSIKVMYAKSESGISGSRVAFDKLEAKLSSLKGRKFYDLIFGVPPNEKYWACVGLVPGDDPDNLGFNTYTIPGGKYIQEKVKDWHTDITAIGKTFQKLVSLHTPDPSRPNIEFYRSMKEVLCRVPID
ncbi:GyrI-like domain-containing protein [Candidatus Gottesmanbacteria bacterium]|nr:GyrI-like domain-containing protein [Candidatus Gottesmanbacteria bacterium]